MARRACITGITGQDGSYLAELLLLKGYEVSGIIRRSSATSCERLDHILDRITLLQADLLDQNSLIEAIREARPQEVSRPRGALRPSAPARRGPAACPSAP